MFRAALGMGGLVDASAGWLGVPHTHMHMHTHARMHTHACMVNMIISCKWLPPLGESMGIPYDVIHACECMHVCLCAHVLGHPLTTPHPHPPTLPPPGGRPLESVKIQ